MSTGSFEDRLRPKPGRTLIVGSRVYPGRVDRRAAFKNAIGVDALAGEGVDRVCDLCSTSMVTNLFIPNSFSHIECISVLEHCENPFKLAQSLEWLLEIGGTIYLKAPFIWREHAYPDDYWRFSIAGLKKLFTEIRWDAEAYLTDRYLSPPPRKLPLNRIAAGAHPYLPRTESCLFGSKL